MIKKDCLACGGTGFVIQEKDGKTAAIRCQCYREERLKLLFRNARIPKRYKDCDLENFEEIHPSHKMAKKIAQQFIREFPVEETSLLFFGDCGAGKTHLAIAILKALIQEKGVHGLYYDFKDLLKEIQSSYNPISQTTEMSILMPLFSAEVVVLDDLGVGKMSEWVRETLEHIINTRYNQKKIMILTTNLPDIPMDAEGESFERAIGARLRSRLYEMCVAVDIKGEDFRRNIRQASYRFSKE